MAFIIIALPILKVNPSAAGDPTSSENWKPFDFLSYWIEQKTDAFILEAFNDWFYEKEKFGTAKSVLGYQMLFANPGEREVLLSQGVEVGLTINTRKSQSLAYQFSKIALHFAAAGPIE